MPKRKKNKFATRPDKTTPPRPVVVVVCDDARTAPAYFNALTRQHKDKLRLTVVPNSHGETSAAKIVDSASAERKKHEGRQSHDRADQTSVWALIDREGTHDRQSAADEAQRKGITLGINVALSKPCYELWTLLHLLDTGEGFADCSEVVRCLMKEWSKRFPQEKLDRKSQLSYGKIIGDRATAVQRAKKHREAHNGAGDPSWTEVYRLIEEIDRLVSS